MEEVEILEERENDKSTNEDVSQEKRAPRTITLAELMALKQQVRNRIERNDAVLTQLDNGFDSLKACLTRMFTFIGECQTLVQVEKQESKDLLRFMRDVSRSGSCKTNVVIPMIAGIPLKKASVSLKRLGPAYLQARPIATSESPASNGVSTRMTRRHSLNASSQAGPSSSGRGRKRL